MTHRIIYPTPSGGVAIVVPSGELSIEEAAAKDVPEGVAYEIVEADAIPSDRSFRNAWKKNGKKIEHDMARAKEIHRDRIRVARELRLAELDVAFQREMEKPSPNIAAIAAQKQALRDAPAAAAINSAATITALKAAWDTDLLGPSPYA